MTENPRTTCPAFVTERDTWTGESLVCFRQEGHPPPWHYDNRGLGAWFRPNGDGQVVIRVGDTAEPPADAGSKPTPEQAAGLSPIALPIDLDQLRAAAPALRTQLIDALRADVTERRKGRGSVVVPEDTYPLVRRLTAAEEILRQFAQAFADAATEAAELTAEEATIALGEQDGIPNGSLFVPDGVGQRIKVSPDWDSNAKGDVWDVGSLVGWLAEDQTADAGVNIEEDGGWTPQIVAGVARDAMHRLLALGRFAPSVKAIEALRLRAAEREDDATAALLRQVRTRGERIYRGVKITREPMPKSQR